MGTLHYGSGMSTVKIPDHVLAHLKAVATMKLRRGESFMVTWRHSEGEAVGRSSLWMQPSIPLLFELDSLEPVQLDSSYLHELANAANSSGGMVLTWDDEGAAVGGGSSIAA
jgi:hypothetical protein